MIWIAFGVGLFVGTFVGVFAICLCQMIARRNEYEPFCYPEQGSLNEFIKFNKRIK